MSLPLKPIFLHGTTTNPQGHAATWEGVARILGLPTTGAELSREGSEGPAGFYLPSQTQSHSGAAGESVVGHGPMCHDNPPSTPPQE